MTKIDYEKAARRSRARDYTGSPLYGWHKRILRFEKRCAICGGPVLPGSAFMRKTGTKWQVAHLQHGPDLPRE